MYTNYEKCRNSKLQGGKVKKIILIILFVCVGSLSFATSLDLTYEIPMNNDQYVINKYAMGHMGNKGMPNVWVFMMAGGMMTVLIIAIVAN